MFRRRLLEDIFNLDLPDEKRRTSTEVRLLSQKRGAAAGKTGPFYEETLLHFSFRRFLPFGKRHVLNILAG